MKKLYYTRLIFAGIIFTLSILAVYGIVYPIKFMDLQFTALLQRVITDFSITAVVLILALAIITFIFGRIYCSMICPFGILQEIAGLIFKRKNSLQKNLPIKYFISAITFGILIGGSAIVIRYIDPYTTFSSALSLSITGLIVTTVVLFLVFFKNRAFCTNICPVGTILGLLSKVSINKIYMDKDKCISCGLCAQNCPSGCINKDLKTVDNETCIKCFKCLSKCHKNAIKYGKEPKENVKFSIKRRNLILASTTLVLLGGAIKAGIEIGKNFAKKIHDVILPPGAVDTNRMANKCLNCNLCIENCPNKILEKANDTFPTVHINYSKGEGYCKFDCKNCSEVCPSGAIKKISIEEKQKTRIGMAMLKTDFCTKCGKCIKRCPTQAISRINKEIIIDGSKCIGCGRCAKICKHKAIEIFAVNEQQII